MNRIESCVAQINAAVCIAICKILNEKGIDYAFETEEVYKKIDPGFFFLWDNFVNRPTNLNPLHTNTNRALKLYDLLNSKLLEMNLKGILSQKNGLFVINDLNKFFDLLYDSFWCYYNFIPEFDSTCRDKHGNYKASFSSSWTILSDEDVEIINNFCKKQF